VVLVSRFFCRPGSTSPPLCLQFFLDLRILFFPSLLPIDSCPSVTLIFFQASLFFFKSLIASFPPFPRASPKVGFLISEFSLPLLFLWRGLYLCFASPPHGPEGFACASILYGNDFARDQHPSRAFPTDFFLPRIGSARFLPNNSCYQSPLCPVVVLFFPLL